MTSQQILDMIKEKYEEHLKMLTPKEQSEFLVKILVNMVVHQKGIIQYLKQMTKA